MTMRWTYLSELGKGGTLDWGGSWFGNVPAAGNILPDLSDTSMYLLIRKHARAGNYGGKQVDWGAMAIKVNGPDLLDILKECYGEFDAISKDSLVGRYIKYAKSLGIDDYVAFLSLEL